MKPSSPPLNSEKLGKFGQAAFEKLCAAASMTCNGSEEDLVGWDYVVTFPAEKPTQAASLDSRAIPHSCYVQVKTIWNWTKDIKLRLSSAEWIAKEAKPAFIYTIKVSRDLSITEAFLIHLLDAPLGVILRRLRLESSKGNSAPNKTVISLTPKREQRFEHSPAAFAAALSASIGPNLQVYIEHKRGQLDSIGFGEDRHKIDGSYYFGEVQTDSYTGVTKAKAAEINISEVRFGIPLVSTHKDVTVEITPKGVPCTVTIRDEGLAVPVVFPAKCLFPGIPKLTTGNHRVILDAGLFKIFINSGTSNISLHEAAEGPLSLWLNFAKLWCTSGAPKGSVEVVSEKGETILSWTLQKGQTCRVDEDANRLLKVCEDVHRMRELAGIMSEPRFNLRQLETAVPRLAELGLVAEWHPGHFVMTEDELEEHEKSAGSKIEMVLVSHVSLGTDVFGYYAVGFLEVTAECDKAVCKEWKLKEVRMLKDFPNSYPQYVDKAKRETGCTRHYARPAAANEQ